MSMMIGAGGTTREPRRIWRHGLILAAALLMIRVSLAGAVAFVEQTGIALTGVDSSSVAWGDYDKDGDLDILLTGDASSGRVSKIYRNNGNNTFTEQTGIVLTGLFHSSVAWGDYDNDGDLDILLTGADKSLNPVSRIYRNESTDVSAPEISLRGNGQTIASGDTTPSSADHTDFGSADISGVTVTRVFTVENRGSGDLSLSGSPRVAISGTHPADFKVTLQPSSPVTASGSTTFQVRFDPNAAGLRQASVSIANNDSDENPCTFAIQGMGTTAPEINVTGNSVSISNGDTTPGSADHTGFGSADTSGVTVTRAFTVENRGSSDLSLSGSPKVTIGGAHPADFTVTVQPVSPVVPSGSTTFQVKFDPGVAGLRQATVIIANNDSDENPYAFAIQGTGTTSLPPCDDWACVYGKAFEDSGDVGLFRRFRDNVLAADPLGSLGTEWLYAESAEALELLSADPTLGRRAGMLALACRRAIADSLAGATGTVENTADVVEFLDDVEMQSGYSLGQLAAATRETILAARRKGDAVMGLRFEDQEGAYETGIWTAVDMQTGDIPSFSTAQPRLQWVPCEAADGYLVWLEDDQGAWRYRRVGAPEWKADIRLREGHYQWWVCPWSTASGFGEWIPMGEFGVDLSE